jgi:predicted dehydrogenase
MKFGIIGTGMIARIHAKAISEIPGARIVACSDVIPARAQEFAALFKCKAYNELSAFLDDPEIEIVNICTPSGLHRDAAIPSAESGRHLIIEKPLEISVGRCLEIIEACQKNNVVLSGIFPSRFSEASQAIKGAVDAHRFGVLAQGSAYVKWWRDQKYYSQGGWKGTRALDGGGALMNQSIHAVDLLLWYMGNVKRLSAFANTIGHADIEVEDNAAAVLEFESGALGAIQGTTATWPGFLKRIEVMGTQGSAIMDEDRLTFWQFAHESQKDEEIRQELSRPASSSGGASDPTAIGYIGHKRQIMDVIEAIQQKRAPFIDGIEATKAVSCIEAIYRSAAFGGAPQTPAAI